MIAQEVAVPHDEPSRMACLRVILIMADLKPTQQRILLADRIIGRHRHFTASDLYAACTGATPLPSLGTIYNTLNQFEGRGLVRALMCSGVQSVYDSNTDHHHHYLMEETGEVIDIPGSGISFVKSPAPPAGFALQRIEVIVHLRCVPLDADGMGADKCRADVSRRNAPGARANK